jgi:acyl-CoA thioesterase-1
MKGQRLIRLVRLIRVTLATSIVFVGANAAACGRGNAGASADSTALPRVSSNDTGKSKTGSGMGAASSGDTAHAPHIRRQRIVFAGTSLTAGLGLNPDSAYPMLIQQKIDSADLPFEVTNAGVSGETSAGLVDRLDWLLKGNFDVMVIETGANDMLRGVPVSALRANLDTILDRIKRARPSATVALIQMEALPNLGRQYGAELHDTYAAAARAHHVVLLPFLLNGVAGNPRLNQGDGLHPNPVGERIVAENVWKGLGPVLEGRGKG